MFYFEIKKIIPVIVHFYTSKLDTYIVLILLFLLLVMLLLLLFTEDLSLLLADEDEGLNNNSQDSSDVCPLNVQQASQFSNQIPAPSKHYINMRPQMLIQCFD